MRQLRQRLGICGLLAISLPAFAGDGALEINQTCATSVAGCFPGDVGGGFPVEVTQPGSYRLTSNLTLSSASQTAIAASAAGATVDLNGFTISGPTACTGSPVSSCAPTGSGVGVSGANETVVKNGRIRGMGSYGVALGARSRVEDLHVLSTGLNGVFVGDQCVVENAIVHGTGEIGIVAGFGSVVRDSTSTANKLDGVVIASGTLQSNTATANGRNGAQIFFGSFRDNDLGGNVAASIVSNNAHASGGNSCPDRTCTSDGARRYYLTKSVHTGSGVLGACDTGFHVASVWEISPTTLRYDIHRGAVQADSGWGPPTLAGWARSGESSRSGLPNCELWTSDSQFEDAFFAVPSGLHPPGMSLSTSPCDTPHLVWCIED